MTVFILKLIAMSTMLVDHIGFWFVTNNDLIRSIGRIAFIIYAFLIAESFYHLKDKPEKLKTHLIKLFMLCIVSEFPFDQFTRCTWINWELQSVLPTLTIGFLALIVTEWWCRKYNDNRLATIIGAGVICLIAAIGSYMMRSDYRFSGVILIILFYQYLNKADELNTEQRMLALLIINTAYLVINIWTRSGFGAWPVFVETAAGSCRRLLGSYVAIVLLAMYRRELGYRSRWFSWLYSCFYPIQFIGLIIVRYYLKGF